jgi:hypothetical protein
VTVAFKSTAAEDEVRWVENTLDRELQLGERNLVRLACAAWRLGPWNLTPWTSLAAIGDDGASWSTWQPLCTVDGDALTRLAILACDRGLRVQIRPSGPMRLKLLVHQRYERDGWIGHSCPTLETVIAAVREVYPPLAALPVRVTE